jgi:hypothetical protein
MQVVSVFILYIDDKCAVRRPVANSSIVHVTFSI